MKEKRRNIPISIFLYLVLGIMLLIRFFLLEFISGFSIIGRFRQGILKDIFIMIWVVGLIIPVLCCRKMKHIWMLPLWMIIATIITTTVNYAILNITADYISVYTREKWDQHPRVRYYMLDSLNEQYDFIGMSEQELTKILGEPNRIIENDGQVRFQYMVGDDFTDPHSYDFIFENAIVVDTSFSQR